MMDNNERVRRIMKIARKWAEPHFTTVMSDEEQLEFISEVVTANVTFDEVDRAMYLIMHDKLSEGNEE